MHCRFNKREEDFSTKNDWDAYLEEIEDLSACLGSQCLQLS